MVLRSRNPGVATTLFIFPLSFVTSISTAGYPFPLLHSHSFTRFLRFFFLGLTASVGKYAADVLESCRQHVFSNSVSPSSRLIARPPPEEREEEREIIRIN